MSQVQEVLDVMYTQEKRSTIVGMLSNIYEEFLDELNNRSDINLVLMVIDNDGKGVILSHNSIDNEFSDRLEKDGFGIVLPISIEVSNKFYKFIDKDLKEFNEHRYINLADFHIKLNVESLILEEALFSAFYKLGLVYAEENYSMYL